MVVKMDYDVIIVGAGPAGLFCAYELIEKNKNLKVGLLDSGFFVKNRVCPMNKFNVPCKKCTPCNILSGYGGAGTFSDGKLNFIPVLGKSNFLKYMSEGEAYQVIDETEKIFNKFKMDADVYPKDMDAAIKFKKDVAIHGARFLMIKQKHLGSDHLPKYIEGICDYLRDKKVDLLERSHVEDIEKDAKGYKVYYTNNKEKKTITSKYVVVAPGRTGAKWLEEFTSKHDIPFTSQCIEIGVRVEVRKDIMEDLTNLIYDPTIFIKTKTYGDEMRTFCTNPGGFVAKENYNNYICVNGHALKDIKSNNTNFAFLSKVNLTEPVTNARMYGESIAQIANVLGDGKPIIQSLKDLKKGRRSTWSRIEKSFIEPTLKDCVAGDLALVMPHRIITNILEGLEKLDEIIPGINNDDTLLYGPEIKFFSNEVETDNKFRLKDENIYFIGDGSGKSGHIVTAAATGLIAADDILAREK